MSSLLTENTAKSEQCQRKFGWNKGPKEELERTRTPLSGSYFLYKLFTSKFQSKLLWVFAMLFDNFAVFPCLSCTSCCSSECTANTYFEFQSRICYRIPLHSGSRFPLFPCSLLFERFFSLCNFPSIFALSLFSLANELRLGSFD